MKHLTSLHLPRAAVSALLVSTLFSTGCNKSADTNPAAAAVTAALDPALATQYGFVPRVAGNAEAFMSVYRLGELWDGFKSSRWAALFQNLSFVKENPQWQQMVAGSATPEAVRAKAIARALFGEEAVFVAAPGAAAQLKILSKAAPEIQALQSRMLMAQTLTPPPAVVEAAPPAGPDAPPAEIPVTPPPTAPSITLTAEDLKKILPLLEAAEFPPVYLACRSAASRAVLDEAVKELTAALQQELPPGISLGSAQADGKYALQTLRFDAAKAIAANEAQFSAQLAQTVPDEAEAKKVRAVLEKKHFEIAWGWVEDHFVISAGPDSSHVKLAASPATSVLANPAVAAGAASFAAKKPLSLSFVSAAFMGALQSRLEIADLANRFLPMLGDKIPAAQMDRINKEAGEFDAKYAAQMAQTYSDSVGASWWDGGLHAESRGGPVIAGDPQPLTMAGMTTPSTFVHLDGRGTPGGVNKRQWTEDFAGLLWNWYQTILKPTLPAENQQQAAMGEAMAVPVLKELWRIAGLISEGLGDESALVIDANGRMPAIPQMPLPASFTENARIPRLAWVVELKDRKKLSEAWTALQAQITQLSAFIPEGTFDRAMLVPQTKTAGGVDISWLPIGPAAQTEGAADLTLHTGITGKHWFLGSSPGLTQELAGAPAKGETAFSVWNITPPAIADWIAATVTAAENSPEIKAQLEPKFQQTKEDMLAISRLTRSVKTIKGKLFKEGADTRLSAEIGIKDAE